MDNVWRDPVSIQPIGRVVSQYREFSGNYDYQTESQVVINEELSDGLIGLEHFSHIYVLYYQHRKEQWKKWAGWGEEGELVLKLPFATEPTCQGVYTTRAPGRPSGIGFCVVELLRREGNRLYVKGLDAFDGTPVLDIKIYIPHYDSYPLAETPLHWCKKHELITASRTLHWDTMNVGLTLGLRTGLRAMQELGLSRGEAVKAEVHGGYFFAQGIEGVTGCSPLRDTMVFERNIKSTGDWMLRLSSCDRAVEIRLNEHIYSGADEVMEVAEDILFLSVEVLPGEKGE